MFSAGYWGSIKLASIFQYASTENTHICWHFADLDFFTFAPKAEKRACPVFTITHVKDQGRLSGFDGLQWMDIVVLHVNYDVNGTYI